MVGRGISEPVTVTSSSNDFCDSLFHGQLLLWSQLLRCFLRQDWQTHQQQGDEESDQEIPMTIKGIQTTHNIYLLLKSNHLPQTTNRDYLDPRW